MKMLIWGLLISSLICCCMARSHEHVVKMKVDGNKKQQQITKVHIVFMNHLDVGYSDGRDNDTGFAVEVLNRYLTEYFARAINMSQTLIKLGYVERFIYTTHPWLVSLYLDCPNITLLSTPLKCPNKTQQTEFALAVFDGHISWHAFPMNIQTDFLGGKLADRAIDISQRLDSMFGIKRQFATMSQRDVPGITKALIPHLMAKGVKAISVGVNPGTAPPDVPSPFVWKLRDSDEDGIMAFWVKGGYPLNPGPDPAHPVGLATDKCISTEKLSEVLCFAFRTDNTGPPATVEEILGYYEILRAEYPGAELVASTFDRFVESLTSVKASLPVRSFEIGDTWIQGITSDPKKCAMYRAFMRAWENCESNGQCSDEDPRIIDMLRFLVKLPEHTWGAHNFLDIVNWTNSELAVARKSQPYKLAENTWREQRQFLDFALKALKNHPLVGMVKAEYEQLQASVPDLSGFSPASVGANYDCPGGVIVQFNNNGALSRLYDPINKREWATPSSTIGQIRYDTYVEQDFIDMAREYNYESGVGYDKPNVTQYAHPEKKNWEISVLNLYMKVNTTTCEFWVKVATNDNQTRTKYGAPEAFYVNYVVRSGSQVDVTLLMIGKVTTRLPESISYTFTPQNQNDYSWYLSKMNQNIDPCDVVLNGSQYCHGVDQNGISFLDKSQHGLQIQTSDIPIVLIGTQDHVVSPFPVPLQPLVCSSIQTMAFNIFNNIWNTNYIYWYPFDDEDADFKARFSIRFI